MRGIMQQALADTDNLFLTKAVADTLMGRTAADTVEYIDNVQGDILFTQSRVGSPKSRVGSPKKPKLEHLPNELLHLVYDKIPSGRDRVALASTSKRMNYVPDIYKSAEHFIRKQADVEAAIRHKAERVTFKNKGVIVSFDSTSNQV